MQTTPTSTLYLCKNVDLDPNYNYTIDFDNITAQENYFINKIANEFNINEGYTYIRDNETLKVQAHIDDLLGCNYLFYDNGNKRYYAFITRKEYVGKTCTRLYFKIDVMQSFMFDYEVDECFIQREHQDRYNSELKPIFNTKLENLELGDSYITTNKQLIKDDNHIWYYVYAKEKLGREYYMNQPNVERTTTYPTYISTINYDDVTDTQTINTGYYMYVFCEGMSIKTELLEKPLSMISYNTIIQDPKVVKVVASRYIPKGINYDAENNIYEYHGGEAGLHLSITPYATIPAEQTLFRELLKIDEITQSDYGKDYDIDDNISTPVLDINNLKCIDNEPKLLTAPYSMLRLNMFNTFFNLKRENFTGDKKLRISQGLVNQTNLIVQPLNYLGEEASNFNLIKSTIDCTTNIRTDAWEEYLAQNRASMNCGLIMAGVPAIAGLAIGALTGGLGWAVAGTTLVSAGGKIASELSRRKSLQETPDEVNNTPSDTYNTTLLNKMAISVEFIEVKNEYKTTAFNYFNRYGYLCNDFKKPNTRSRYYFNYIKTIEVNLKTNIDNDFKSELKAIYDNGITIWHYRNAQTFKGVNNYDYENVEINLMEV